MTRNPYTPPDPFDFVTRSREAIELMETPGQTYQGALYPDGLTLLTVPTPENWTPAALEFAKRRAQFPPNRRGQRAFLASERRRS